MLLLINFLDTGGSGSSESVAKKQTREEMSQQERDQFDKWIVEVKEKR